MVFEGIREIGLLRRYVERIFRDNPEKSAGLDVDEVLEKAGIGSKETAMENFRMVRDYLASIGLMTTPEAMREIERQIDQYASVESESFLRQLIDALRQATPEELERIKQEVVELAPEELLELRREIDRLEKELAAERLRAMLPSQPKVGGETEEIARELRKSVEITERRLLDEIAALRDELQLAVQNISKRVEEKAEAKITLPPPLMLEDTARFQICPVHLGEKINELAMKMFGKTPEKLTTDENEQVVRQAEKETWENPLAIVETHPQIFAQLQELQDAHGRYLFPRGDKHWYYCDIHKEQVGITFLDSWQCRLMDYIQDGTLSKGLLLQFGISSAWVDTVITKCRMRVPR